MSFYLRVLPSHMYAYHMVTGACLGQKRVTDPLELDFYATYDKYNKKSSIEYISLKSSYQFREISLFRYILTFISFKLLYICYFWKCLFNRIATQICSIIFRVVSCWMRHFMNANKLHHRYTLKLTHIQDSHNGFCVYSYQTEFKDADGNLRKYDILNNDDSLPVCIYHPIKQLYHTHEHHAKNQDSILIPYCTVHRPCIDQQNHAALQFYLNLYEEKFVGKCRPLRNEFPSRFGISFALLDTFVVILFFVSGWLIYQTYYIPAIYTIIGWLIYLVYKWHRVYNDILRQGFEAQGEMVYCNTLLKSIYIKRTDNVIRRTCFNIENTINDIRILTNKIQHRFNIALTGWSVALSILLFFIGSIAIPEIVNDKTLSNNQLITKQQTDYEHFRLRYGWIPRD